MSPYQTKVRGGVIPLIVAVVAAAGAVVAFAFRAEAPQPFWLLLGLAVLLGLISFVFRSLTLSVGSDGVAVSWGGVINKRIPLGEITGVDYGKYRWAEFGGWGWRMNLRGGTAFSQIGVKNAVYIHYGQGKTLAVTVNDPAMAAEAIREWA